MALTSSRSAQRRGRPRRAGSGNSGASDAHSASVRSQGERKDAGTGEHGIGDLFSEGRGLAASFTHRGVWLYGGHGKGRAGPWKGRHRRLSWWHGASEGEF